MSGLLAKYGVNRVVSLLEERFADIYRELGIDVVVTASDCRGSNH